MLLFYERNDQGSNGIFWLFLDVHASLLIATSDLVLHENYKGFYEVKVFVSAVSIVYKEAQVSYNLHICALRFRYKEQIKPTFLIMFFGKLSSKGYLKGQKMTA